MDAFIHFSENHAHIYYLLFGLALIVELTVLGLSGPLLFFALACFATALLIQLGLISGWEAELFSVGMFSVFFALIMWKPLKKMQNPSSETNKSSDLVGIEVPCVTAVTKSTGSVRYSGIDWPARLMQPSKVDEIEPGDLSKVCAIEGNILMVKPC